MMKYLGPSVIITNGLYISRGKLSSVPFRRIYTPWNTDLFVNGAIHEGCPQILSVIFDQHPPLCPYLTDPCAILVDGSHMISPM